MVQGQATLFGHDEPRFDETFAGMRRTELGDGAWLDYLPAWLEGHATLFDAIASGTSWRREQRKMYDRVVDVPRSFAVLPDGGASHPLLARMATALSRRYQTEFVRVSVALYRDGSDSVAWHGDYVARNMDQALVATVSVGAPRRFLMRPKSGGPWSTPGAARRSRSMDLGWGDLLVMGGTCQRTWQHCVPKVKRADPRIAIMFRPVWEHDATSGPDPESTTEHTREHEGGHEEKIRVSS